MFEDGPEADEPDADSHEEAGASGRVEGERRGERERAHFRSDVAGRERALRAPLPQVDGLQKLRQMRTRRGKHVCF